MTTNSELNHNANIDLGTSLDNEKVVGGEIITPTARLVGEKDNTEAVKRGWLSAIDRSMSNEQYALDEKKRNLQTIVDAAIESGLTKEELKAHLESRGVVVIPKENLEPSAPALVSAESDPFTTQKQTEIAKRNLDILTQPGTYLHRTNNDSAQSIINSGLRIRGVDIMGHVTGSSQDETTAVEKFNLRHKQDTAVVVIEMIPDKKDVAGEWAISQYQKDENGDFIYPSRHIKGFIDRQTGNFIPNPNFIHLTDEEKAKGSQINPQSFFI